MTTTRLPLNKRLLQEARQARENPQQAVSDALKKLSEKQQWPRLFVPVGELANEARPELSLPLLDDKTAIARDGFGWNWQAEAGGSAVLDVDLLNAEQMGRFGVQALADHQALCYSATLGLNGRLAGKDKIAGWSVGAALEGKGSVRLDWFVQAPNPQKLTDAIVAASDYWLFPDDLPALLDLASRDRRFGGVSIGLQGTLQADLDAKAEAARTAWSYGLDGDKVALGMSVGVQADARLKLDGNYRLRVTPAKHRDQPADAPWGVKVQLHRDSTRHTEFGLDLDAGLGLTVSLASVERILRAPWPKADAAQLEALTLPGHAVLAGLRQRIASGLDNGELRALAGELVGPANLKPLRELLIGRLAEPLADELDRDVEALTTGRIDLAVLQQQWTRRLLGETNSHADDPGLRGLLADAVNQARQRFDQAVDEVEKQIAGAVASQLDKTLASLGELGARLKRVSAKLGQKAADRALLVKIVIEYSQARRSLQQALETAQRARIKLALGTEWQNREHSGLMFEAWFAPGSLSAEAERLYHALSVGRLDGLNELAAAAQSKDAIRDVGGWLLAGGRRLRKTRIGIDLLGFSFGNTEQLLTELEIKTDLSGRLLAATAQAGAETSVKNPWKDRRANLGIVANLGEDASGRRALSLELLGAFVAEQERTDRQSMQQLLDLLAATRGVPNRLNLPALLDAPPDDAVNAKRFWRELTLALPVYLTAEEWQRYCQQGTRQIRLVFLRYGLRCLDACYREKKPFRFDSPSQVIRECADRTVADAAALSVEERLLRYLDLYPAHYVSARSPDSRIAAKVGFDGVVESGDLAHKSDENFRFGVFHRLAAVLRSGVALAELSAALRQALDAQTTDKPEEIRDRVEPHLTAMRDALSAVAVASQTFTAEGFGTPDESLAWPFAIFTSAVAELAGHPGFVPLIARPERPDLPLILGENN